MDLQRKGILWFFLIFITNVETLKVQGGCNGSRTCSQICKDVGINEVQCSCLKQYRLAEDGRTCLLINADGSTWEPPKRLVPKRRIPTNPFIFRKDLFKLRESDEDGSGSGSSEGNCDDEDGCSSAGSGSDGDKVTVEEVEKESPVNQKSKSTMSFHSSTLRNFASRSPVMTSKTPYPKFSPALKFSNLVPHLSGSKSPSSVRVASSSTLTLLKQSIFKGRHSNVLQPSSSSSKAVISHVTPLPKLVTSRSSFHSIVRVTPTQSVDIKQGTLEEVEHLQTLSLSPMEMTLGISNVISNIKPTPSVSLKLESTPANDGFDLSPIFSRKSTKTLPVTSFNSIPLRKSFPSVLVMRTASTDKLTPALSANSEEVTQITSIKGNQHLTTQRYSKQITPTPILPDVIDSSSIHNSIDETTMKSYYLIRTKGKLSTEEHITSLVTGIKPVLHSTTNTNPLSTTALVVKPALTSSVEGIRQLSTSRSSYPSLSSLSSNLSLRVIGPEFAIQYGKSNSIKRTDMVMVASISPLFVATENQSSPALAAAVLFANGTRKPDNLRIAISKSYHSLPIVTSAHGQKRSLNCTALGCRLGETCSAGYCQCPFGREGNICRSDSSIREPHFNMTSYMRFPRQRGLYRRFTIVVEFLAEDGNGVILSSSDFDQGGKDFFALGLQNRKPTFRFDCGSGINVAQSSASITLGQWHRVTIFRKGARGWVQLDDESPQSSRGKTGHRHLSLGRLLVGGFPRDIVYKGTGFDGGFQGCLHKIVINRKPLPLASAITTAVDGFGVTQCQHASCWNSPCSAGASCHLATNGQRTCLCPLGYHGNTCNKRGHISMPAFDERSYLAFDIASHQEGHVLNLELVVKPSAQNASGVLLFNGYESDGEGDYYALFLHNGRPVFQLDCGGGHITIRAAQFLTPNKWHRISVSKRGKTSSLQVDDKERHFGTTPGHYTRLNTGQTLFIGGLENWKDLPEYFDIRQGFTGCIQKVTVNYHDLVWKRAKNGLHVQNCKFHPCGGEPCGPNGKCQPTYQSFVCHCKLGYEGRFCHDAARVTSPAFEKHSYLALRESSVIKRLRRTASRISFQFKTESRNGSILWIGQGQHYYRGDYQSLFLEEGYLLCRFNLGGGRVTLRTKRVVNDGKWHKVMLDRVNGNTRLHLDSYAHDEGRRRGQYHILNTRGRIYLGFAVGSRHKGFLTSKVGFQGCLREFHIGNSKVDLLRDVEEGFAIKQCQKR